MTINTLNLTLDIPCIQGKFGDRLACFTTQIPPQSIVNLLGHDPRSKHWSKLPDDLKSIYQYLQRKTSKDRRESIEAYIEDRLGPTSITIGAFPSISIALTRPAVFVPYDDKGVSVNLAVGKLRIDVSSTNMRILLDGLGRVTAALDLEESGHGALVGEFLFPVTIYAPQPDTPDLTWGEMGQLFHDFNFRVAPVSAQHAIALDTSDLYISLANKLGQASFIKDNGGVAERAASLGSKSTELVVQSVLVRAVRGACEGRTFQESNISHAQNPNLTSASFQQLRLQLEEFFTGLVGRMGDRFAGKEHRKDSMLLTAPGWQAIGVIFNDIHFRLGMEAEQRAAVMDKIAAIDWSRYNPDWIAMGIGQPEVDKKTGQKVVDAHGRARVALAGAGRSNTQAIIDYMRVKAGIASQLTSQAALLAA
jgi:hypothetical protein